MKHKILSATLLLCASGLTSAYAEDVFKNDPVVVTATRYEKSVSKEGKSISVVTEDEIKKSGKKTVADLLEIIPGVTITRKGVDGGITNVYIRGSKSGNVLLMIDGVRVTDPIGIEKLYDISGIMSSNVERIEVVKGAMSSMYGAMASGGVINIITKKGSGKQVTIAGEYGSNNTHKESVSVSDSTEKSNFFFSGSHYRTDGISKAKRSDSINSYDDDEYQNITASGRIDTKIGDTASVSMTMNYTDSELDIDDGSYADDPNRVYSSKLFTSRGEFKHSPFTWWTYKGGVSYMSFIREDVDPVDAIDTTENNTSTFNGANVGADLISIFNILNFDVLTLGVDILDEKGNSYSAYAASPSISEEKSIFTKSFFVHDAINVADILNINAGARIDDHDVFGSHWTWDSSASVVIPLTGTKFKASTGTGFRAPSLYELYDSYAGNAELDPEKTFVYDAGIYQEFFSGLFSIDCTYFVQKYKDMIQYNNSTYKYYNADNKITYKGVEVSSTVRLFEALVLMYGYTYLKYDTEDTVYKRPAHKHTASAIITPVSGLNITAVYLYVDNRNDQYYPPSAWDPVDVKLHSYHKFDMNIRYALNETITFTARGENLTDEDYEETYGYNTKGRSFYGGAEITL
ncbi:MAG TPA: TonB-dependent receptor [Spirochaetota bacterium]|nr:TonB-dependent receptor [Spirochaetota bacterium]